MIYVQSINTRNYMLYQKSFKPNLKNSENVCFSNLNLELVSQEGDLKAETSVGFMFLLSA